MTVFIIVLNYDINKRDQTITEIKQQLDLRDQTIALLSTSNNDFKKAEPLLASLQNILPSKDQLITFPSELQTIARGYGIDIGFTFGSEVGSSATEPGSIKFSMTLAGEFPDIVDFLEALERHKYFIKFDSVDIRRTNNDIFSLVTNGIIYTN